MKKTVKRIVAVFAIMALMLAATACSGDKKNESADNETTIVYWSALDGNTAQSTTNLGETEFAKSFLKSGDNYG